MKNTVLGHLAASMVEQKENFATEALAFILNRSADARAALARRLAASIGQASISRVTTQVAVGAESRPDMELFGDERQPLGFIEAKFWAEFTKAQPVEYVKRLEECGGRVLVLLVPEQRRPTTRAYVIARLKEAGSSVVANTQGIAVGAIHVEILSWSELLPLLREAVRNDDDVKSDVDQLYGLTMRLEQEGFLPLSRTDLDNQAVPRLILSLAKLAEKIVRGAGEKPSGLLTLKGFMPRHFADGSGRYFSIWSLECWLGLDHSAWSARGRSPIWMRFEDYRGSLGPLRDALRTWLNSDPPRAYAEGKMIYVPILLLAGAEENEVVTDAVRQIRELDEEVAMHWPGARSSTDGDLGAKEREPGSGST